MINAVGTSAQVALQASTIGPSSQQVTAARVENKTADRGVEAQGGAGRAKGDTVTISTEARQLTQSALDAAQESQESPEGKSKDESKEESGNR